MAFVFIQGLTYLYGVFYMLLALWSAYTRAKAGDGTILRFLAIDVADYIDAAVLTALVYKCADVLLLVLIAIGASAWLVDMFVKKSQEICSNRSKSARQHCLQVLALVLLLTYVHRHPIFFCYIPHLRNSVVRASQAKE